MYEDSTLLVSFPRALQPLPLDQRRHRESLTVRHWGDGDVLVVSVVVAHPCAEGDVSELSVGSDTIHHAV